MAERIEEKNVKSNPLHYYSGTSEEIFNKLPKTDQRPYVIIGSLNFYITILFSALIFLITDRYNLSIFLKVFITILSLGLMMVFQRRVTQRLIHQFDTGSRIFFWSSGAIIASLFIIAVYNSWVINDPYYGGSYAPVYTDTTAVTPMQSDTAQIKMYDINKSDSLKKK